MANILITIAVGIVGFGALGLGFVLFYLGVAAFAIWYECGPQSARSIKDIATLGPIKRKRAAENRSDS